MKNTSGDIAMPKEFGGYFGLEIPYRNNGFYDCYAESLLTVNSARAALYYALKDAHPSMIYYPYYNCQYVLDILKTLNVPYKLYKIDKNFMPINIQLREGEYLYWINYFGLVPRKDILALSEAFANLIIDNAQAFYSYPLATTYNIYSCRKFFGVSDGGYLIKNGLNTYSVQPIINHELPIFLLKSIEEGTNAAYQDYLKNEDKFITNVSGMSKLSNDILSSIDYSRIANIRRNNFILMDYLLGPYNELKWNLAEQVPMVYPFLINKPLRSMLIANKIYIPQWWKYLIDITEDVDFENYLSKHLLPLPIDQRYTAKDIFALSQFILKAVEEF